MKSRIPSLIAAACAALASAAPASAHHAFNMYDGKVLPLQGVVTSFTWKNPHAMLELMVGKPGGGQEMWTVELSAPNIIGRRGWSKTSLKVGDKIPLTIHPMKDGSKYGLMMTTTTPAGVVLKDKA